MWLHVLSQGAGLVAPPIRECFCTVVFLLSGEILYFWAVYIWRESFGVLQMTGSLLHVVLSCRLTDLCDCLTRLCLRVPRSCTATLLCLDCVVYVLNLTVSQYCFVTAMATGNSQPGADRKGIDFEVHVQIPWNAPEAYVKLNSPEVFELDTDFFRLFWACALGIPTPHQSGFCWVEPRGVFGCWFRIRKNWIGGFMTSRSWT